MPKRSYYPEFYRLLVQLARYLARYELQLIARNGLIGTPYAAQLTTLVNAINDILTNWPLYVEVA